MNPPRTRTGWWVKKWRHYERNSLPWRRLAIHREFLKRTSFVRWPVHGPVLRYLRDGQLELGEHVLFEPGVWLSLVQGGRLRMGDHSGLNRGVFVSASELVEIGAHSKVGNWSFITDGHHRYGDLDRPFTWQGMVSKGPTRIGENVWVGVGSAIMGGVTIGDRCIIGANSVVTRDVPSYTICAGAPARVIREIDRDALAATESGPAA